MLLKKTIFVFWNEIFTFRFLSSSTDGLKLSFLRRKRFFSSLSRFISSLDTSEKVFIKIKNTN